MTAASLAIRQTSPAQAQAPSAKVGTGFAPGGGASQTDLAQIGAGLFRQRQSYAARMVAEGRLTREQAEAKLRPWLAIAAMAGADLPELELHGNELWPDTGKPVIHRRFAADIAPAAEWRAALATARDAALKQQSDSADQSALKQQGGSANQNALKQQSGSADQNTRDLIRLANALHAPPAMPAGEGGSTHHRSETP